MNSRISQKLSSLTTDDRLREGYVIILPGIEGRSVLNTRIALGLEEAGVPFGIEIYDWTHRLLVWPTFIYNLRSDRLHALQSRIIADKILSYQNLYPNRPVYLIGHSGGGAMSLRTLECLPDDKTITGAVLLGAAMSPGYRLRPALKHVDRKIWNFSSWGDCFFLGLFTSIAGTVDGRHSPCAGMLGFTCGELSAEEKFKYAEFRFRMQYFRDMNLAGHFGFTATRFVRNHVAPLLLGCQASSEVFTDEFNSRLASISAAQGG